MIAIPLQYFGLGDNIFTVELMNKFIASGYDIIYPVVKHHVGGLQRAYPHIKWVDYTTLPINYETRVDNESEVLRILPIRYADQIMKRPYQHCMRAKYEMYGFDYRDWRTAMYQRDLKKEKALFNNTGQLMNGREYNLISPYFGTDRKHKADIKIDNDLTTVELKYTEGYSLFDWSYIIENATYIHAASSSILYLLELLDLKAKEVHLYARKPIEPHFKNVDYLFTKQYKLHL